MIIYGLLIAGRTVCGWGAEASGWVMDLFLGGMRWCAGRAPEWRPRLWQRDRDPRSETEERQP